ncbi:MAG: beta-lactamase [Frankiales bacterium]|nr:beta-lactamase [Frankiales bacterium]
MSIERDHNLTSFVEDAASELGVPGISVGVVVEGRELAATIGVTSTSDPLAVDEDTLFMIGSTSKTFTATALMSLVEDGLLRLSDRLIEHLPEFRLQDQQVAETVTVGHLLNHTGGWRGDLTSRTGWGDDALARALDDVAAAPQELPMGSFPSYSNSGFLLAGHLLATLRGTTFEQAVRELVLDPLGLTGSCYFPWELAHRRHAVAHVVQDQVATPVLPYPVERALGPAGGLNSSLRDQLAYARFHLDGTTTGTAPISEETRLRMQQPTVAARSTIEGIGLSWLLSHHGGVRLVSHGGNVSNLQTSTFVLAPDHGFAMTVMANTKHAAAIGGRALTWAVEHYLGIAPPPSLPTTAFDAADLVGLYDMGPFAWSLTNRGRQLFVEMKVPDDVPEEIRVAFMAPAKELVAVGEDVFALAADPVMPVLDVRRAADGTVEGIVHGMRFARRVP